MKKKKGTENITIKSKYTILFFPIQNNYAKGKGSTALKVTNCGNDELLFSSRLHVPNLGSMQDEICSHFI